MREFAAVAFGLAGAIALLLWTFESRLPRGAQLAIVATAYMWSPLLAALYATRRTGSLAWLRGVLARPPSFPRLFATVALAAVLLYLTWLALGGLAAASGLPGFGRFARSTTEMLAAAAPDVAVDAARVPPLAVQLVLAPLAALVAGFTVNGLAAFGEEAGWRGFLLPRALASRVGPDVFVGSVWGLWHAPLILLGHNYGARLDGPAPAFALLGVPVMVAFCIALSRLLRVVLARSRTVYSAAALHGAINGFGPALAAMAIGAAPLLGVPAGLLGALGAWACAALVERWWARGTRAP